MFGTVPTNTFSSPAPWQGGDEERKAGSNANSNANANANANLNAAPSPDGTRSHNGSTGTGPSAGGEEKDPFLSLLEQLAENEHARGQGNELDFFLAGAQG